MTRQDMIHDCEQQVGALLPDLPRPEQKALALLVDGVVVSGQATVRAAGAAAPGAAQDLSKQRRAQRLLANPRLEVNRAQRRLVARVLGRCQGRVDLLLDATTTGATATQGGTVTLCFALAWRRRAIPLVWRTWTAEESGQDWASALAEMAQVIRAALPPETQVVVLADRGLSGEPFARLWQELGWHFLLRVTRRTRVRQADGVVVEIGALAPTPGSQCCLSGVTLYAPRVKCRAGAGKTGGWERLWDAGLSLQVVAVWYAADGAPADGAPAGGAPAGGAATPPDPAKAWLLVTDLPATLARCREYRRRTWEEELFRDLKGMGWQWQASRVRQPERVARLILVLALATLWMLALAQRVIRRGWRPLVEARSRRTCSIFQVGLRYLRRCLATGTPIPVHWALFPIHHPALKLS